MLKKTKIFGAIFFLIFLSVIVFLGKKHSGYPATKEEIIKIKLGQEFFTAEVADNQEKKEKGLSGRESLCEKCAMLFLFDDSAKRNFWMKDMHFDLDIIWVRNNKIVKISPNISYKRGENEVASSVESVDKVIEINAGMSEKLGLKTGDSIE